MIRVVAYLAEGVMNEGQEGAYSMFPVTHMWYVKKQNRLYLSPQDFGNICIDDISMEKANELCMRACKEGYLDLTNERVVRLSEFDKIPGYMGYFFPKSDYRSHYE